MSTLTPIRPPVDNRRVLIDHVGAIKLTLQEDKVGKKLIAEGKIGHCDIPTANGRVYTRAVMEREVARLQERIAAGSLLGAVDHPGDGKSRIMEAGHIVRGLWIDKDGSVHGRFEIVEETGPGAHLAAFLRRGAAIGMSSRGLGSTHTNESGQDVVGEDFKLASYDFVCDPAVSSAYPQFFNEDTNVTEKVTVDDLRVKFPKLIRQVEEQAHEVAKNTTLEAVRGEMESEVEEALKLSKDKLREEIKVEVLPDIVREVRDDFSVKLVRALQGMRKECEESVRSELLSDPTVAGAKLTLESIAKMVSPFNPPADVKAILGEKDKSLAEIKAELEASKKAIEEANAAKLKAEQTTRELGFKLFIEQALTGRDDAVEIRKLVGDVSNYPSAKELKAKLESVIKTADEARAIAEARAKTEIENEKKLAEAKINLAKQRAARIEEDKNSAVAALSTKLEALSKRFDDVVASKDVELASREAALEEAERKMARLEQNLNRAVNLAESLKTQSYAEQRSAGHPRRKEIMESVQRGKVKSKAEINQLAEDLDFAAEEPGGVSERIRRNLSKGRESMREAERAKQEVLNDESGATPIPGLEDVGVSMEEILNLSGVNKNKGK